MGAESSVMWWGPGCWPAGLGRPLPVLAGHGAGGRPRRARGSGVDASEFDVRPQRDTRAEAAKAGTTEPDATRARLRREPDTTEPDAVAKPDDDDRARPGPTGNQEPVEPKPERPDGPGDATRKCPEPSLGTRWQSLNQRPNPPHPRPVGAGASPPIGTHAVADMTEVPARYRRRRDRRGPVDVAAPADTAADTVRDRPTRRSGTGPDPIREPVDTRQAKSADRPSAVTALGGVDLKCPQIPVAPVHHHHSASSPRSVRPADPDSADRQRPATRFAAADATVTVQSSSLKVPTHIDGCRRLVFPRRGRPAAAVVLLQHGVLAIRTECTATPPRNWPRTPTAS